MAQPPQELTPLQKDIIVLHDLALGCLIPSDSQVQLGKFVAKSHNHNGVELRHFNDPARYLLQIVGPTVPKPNTRNTTQSIVRWEEAAPESGVFEIRENNESNESVTMPVVLPETKQQIIDTLSRFLIEGFNVSQAGEKP